MININAIFTIQYTAIYVTYILNLPVNLNCSQKIQYIQMRTFFTFLVIIICLTATFEKPFNLFKHPLSSGARCLDGSQGAIYFSQGQKNDKFILYFEGGGVCQGYTLHQTIQNCHERSKTHLGSSQKYPEIRDFSRFTILSDIKEQNPLYYDWNKVFIPYCDGSMHQGSRPQPIKYGNDQLYFRGANNTLTHFTYLDEKYQLFQAKNIVVSGTSAGAQATMMWGNTVYKNSKHPQGVLLIADSGIFVSDPQLAPGIRKYAFISVLANQYTPVPIEECRKVYKQCTTAEVLAQYIIPPIIILQSLYDVYSIRNILLISCPENSFPATFQKCDEHQMKRIQKHKEETLNIIQKFKKNKKNSVWAISCAQHGFLYDFSYYNSQQYLVPQISGSSVFDLLINYQEGKSEFIIDNLRWPQNYACNGKFNLMQHF